MIEIHPNITNIYSCPLCGEPLTLVKFLITGMRNLVEGDCKRCGRGYYTDMPSGSGIYYPVTVDKATGALVDPPYTNWFTDGLIMGMQNKDIGGAHIEVERIKDYSQIVLVNCLNTCYGDCLHLLFNAQYYLEHCPQLGVVVLIPKNIAHFVPDGVAEIWTSNLPMRECGRWNVALERQVGDLICQKEKAYLGVAYPHLHPAHYDLDSLAKPSAIKPPGLGSPVIVVSCREDARVWGGSLATQQQNIQQLHGQLRARFPNMSFVLIGVGASGQYSEGILDKRAMQTTPELEQYWIDLLNHTDCVVGVHGSNMITASGLARFTIELIPEHYYGNFGQTYLARSDDSDWRVNLFRFRTLYGNKDLTDVPPYRVAAVIKTQLLEGECFETMMSLDHQPREASIATLARLRAEYPAAWTRVWRGGYGR